MGIEKRYIGPAMWISHAEACQRWPRFRAGNAVLGQAEIDELVAEGRVTEIIEKPYCLPCPYKRRTKANFYGN